MQSWKGCVGAIPPWVRIPSPLNFYFEIIKNIWNEDENPLLGFERERAETRIFCKIMKLIIISRVYF